MNSRPSAAERVATIPLDRLLMVAFGGVTHDWLGKVLQIDGRIGSIHAPSWRICSSTPVSQPPPAYGPEAQLMPPPSLELAPARSTVRRNMSTA